MPAPRWELVMGVRCCAIRVHPPSCSGSPHLSGARRQGSFSCTFPVHPQVEAQEGTLGQSEITALLLDCQGCGAGLSSPRGAWWQEGSIREGTHSSVQLDGPGWY